jgi:hypothetical protein
MWVHPAGDGADTFREEKAPKGEIPGALPARNKAGAVSEGESRQEGNQTLQAERKRAGKTRIRWTSDTSSAVGNESP